MTNHQRQSFNLDWNTINVVYIKLRGVVL